MILYSAINFIYAPKTNSNLLLIQSELCSYACTNTQCIHLNLINSMPVTNNLGIQVVPTTYS